ncbi:MAG: hypothetical protein A3G84_08785 [Chloroflexi bacterium RIFCSPLOWO2_12_FULL_71_12]|nr:MAG: hypothetical protein A3H36_02350 [Chloroflexi bacterium RIFCSPLOWO2_02_FULL_71_16]OGO73425.1 MAG: hypothetical protein A3G84_08785 [Chloroflexi bacterium RIFCSPLOWO2_12_FULL_71_12]
MDAYLLLKFVHVSLAIVAVGANLTYGIWLNRAERDPQHLAYVLRTVKLLDQRVANPSYGLLLVTGLALAWIGSIPYETFWIAASLALYLVAVAVGIVLYAPVIRRQLELASAGQAGTPAYRAVAARGRAMGVITGVVVIAIVFLMVVKPAL